MARTRSTSYKRVRSAIAQSKAQPKERNNIWRHMMPSAEVFLCLWDSPRPREDRGREQRLEDNQTERACPALRSAARQALRRRHVRMPLAARWCCAPVRMLFVVRGLCFAPRVVEPHLGGHARLDEMAVEGVGLRRWSGLRLDGEELRLRTHVLREQIQRIEGRRLDWRRPEQPPDDGRWVLELFESQLAVALDLDEMVERIAFGRVVSTQSDCLGGPHLRARIQLPFAVVEPLDHLPRHWLRLGLVDETVDGASRLSHTRRLPALRHDARMRGPFARRPQLAERHLARVDGRARESHNGNSADVSRTSKFTNYPEDNR